MKNAVFWDVAPCRSCVNCRFGGMYRLHQGRQVRNVNSHDLHGTTSQKTTFCICCHRNPFTEQLPSDSLGIVHVFTGYCQGTHVPSRDRCIATAIHTVIYFTLLCVWEFYYILLFVLNSFESISCSSLLYLAPVHEQTIFLTSFPVSLHKILILCWTPHHHKELDAHLIGWSYEQWCHILFWRLLMFFST
jgi:hypothetical protein